MALTLGVDFRATGGFVSDPNASYTSELGAVNTDYPVSFGGTTIGWESGFTGGSTRDRDNTIDARIAGTNFSSVAASFRIDLPSAGQYSIQLAMGDTFTQNLQLLKVFDNASLLLTLDQDIIHPGGLQGWIDASGAVFNAASLTVPVAAANWAIANPVNGGGAGAVTLTFASTIARITIGDGSNNTILNHIWINDLGGPTPPVTGPSNVYFDTIF